MSDQSYEKKIHEEYYTRQNTGQELRYKWFAKRYFKGIKSKKILEIGCGDGGVIQYLKRDNEVYGVDISKNGVDQLSKMAIKAFQKDISSERLPFNDSQMDYIIILETLEHLKSPQNALEEIQRVLKKGGIMIASIPNPRTSHKFIYPSLFRYNNFKEYLINNRFILKESTSYGFCPPFWKNLKKVIERKNSLEKKNLERENENNITFFSKLALFLSSDLITKLKPKFLGWSFVYVCINSSNFGAKNLYTQIALDTKKAY